MSSSGLLRPRWIVGHVLALVAVIAFVQLGLWQLRRLDERQTFNAEVVGRAAPGFQPLADLIAGFGDDPDALDLRPVVVEGVYVLDEEVIVQGRSLRGRSGHHIATPLLLDDGRGIIVNRGWVPIDVSDPPVVGAEPPSGQVVVRGLARKPQLRGRFGPVDPADGVLDRVARVDVPRLQRQSSLDLHGFYVELQGQEPPQEQFPIPLDPPVLDEGPHRSYAVQWFAFALVTVIGYPLLLYRTARPRRAGSRGAGSGSA